MKKWDKRLIEVKDAILATNASYKQPFLNELATRLDAVPQNQWTALSDSLHMKRQATKEVRDLIRTFGLIERLMVPQANRRPFATIVATYVNDPVFMLKSELSKIIKSYDPANPNPPDLAKHRPLLIGCSISGGNHPGPGTIACIVLCNRTNRPMILGNEHVMRAEFGTATTAAPDILQPSKGNGGSPSDKVATYDRGLLDHRIDAAVAYLANGINWANRTPEGEALRGSNTNVAVNDVVWKRGTASRRTDGTVVSITANKSVPHARFGGNINFANQIEVKVTGPKEEFQIPGDSGSALLNTNNEIIGIMHGGGKDGGGIATPIDTVFQLLDVRLP